jgi:hypothetical protein
LDTEQRGSNFILLGRLNQGKGEKTVRSPEPLPKQPMLPKVKRTCAVENIVAEKPEKGLGSEDEDEEDDDNEGWLSEINNPFHLPEPEPEDLLAEVCNPFQLEPAAASAVSLPSRLSPHVTEAMLAQTEMCTRSAPPEIREARRGKMHAMRTKATKMLHAAKASLCMGKRCGIDTE